VINAARNINNFKSKDYFDGKEKSEELSNTSIMASTSGNVTRKPHTELLKFSDSQAFPNQVRNNCMQYHLNTTYNFFNIAAHGNLIDTRI